MKRVPVYKICERCNGSGEVEVESPYGNIGGHTTTGLIQITCKICEGTGREDTGMFIEDPYNLYDLEDENGG